jgi:hypothetical protein
MDIVCNMISIPPLSHVVDTHCLYVHITVPNYNFFVAALVSLAILRHVYIQPKKFQLKKMT